MHPVCEFFVLRCVTLNLKNHWWGAEKRWGLFIGQSDGGRVRKKYLCWKYFCQKYFQQKYFCQKYFHQKYFRQKNFRQKHFRQKYFCQKYLRQKYFRQKYFRQKYFHPKYFRKKYFFRFFFEQNIAAKNIFPKKFTKNISEKILLPNIFQKKVGAKPLCCPQGLGWYRATARSQPSISKYFFLHGIFADSGLGAADVVSLAVQLRAAGPWLHDSAPYAGPQVTGLYIYIYTISNISKISTAQAPLLAQVPRVPRHCGEADDGAGRVERRGAGGGGAVRAPLAPDLRKHVHRQEGLPQAQGRPRQHLRGLDNCGDAE